MSSVDFVKILLSFAIASLFFGQITKGARCSRKLGMQSKRIPDENITSSSQLSSNHSPAFARLDGPKAWCSAPGDNSPYIQILLDEKKLITAIKTQGSSHDFSWSRKYDVRYLKEGKWTSYKEDLTGNRNSRSGHRTVFNPPIRTRSIRIYPKDPLTVTIDVTAPVVPCLRLELYGCSAPVTDCPVLGTPISGRKYGSEYNHGDIVNFECDDGFVLKGSAVRKCLDNGTWNGTETICKEYTCNSENQTGCNKTNAQGIGTRGRAINLNDEGGLDLVFVIDASSSVKPDGFKLGLNFSQELVRTIGTSKRADGTRIALVTFGTEAKVEFNLGDAKVDTLEKAIEAIGKVNYIGGATASALALQKVRKVVVPNAREGSKRAMMFITDGMSNIGGPPEKEANYLKDKDNFEIYAIGVGKKVKVRELMAIASADKDGNLQQAIKKAVEMKIGECAQHDPALKSIAKLVKIACAGNYHYIVKGRVLYVDEDYEMVEYVVKIKEIIKQGNKQLQVKQKISFWKRGTCTSPDLKEREEYLFMGQDDKGGRYELDKTSFVKRWLKRPAGNIDKLILDGFAKHFSSC